MGIAVDRYPHEIDQKVNRALTCIVRPGTVVLVMVEDPVAIPPDPLTLSPVAGIPKLA